MDEKIINSAMEEVEFCDEKIKLLGASIDDYHQRQNRHLIDLRITSGVFAGVALGFLNSDLVKIESLAIIGFLLLVVVVVLTIIFSNVELGRQHSLVQHLKLEQNELLRHQDSVMEFIRGRMDVVELKQKRKGLGKWLSQSNQESRGLAKPIRLDKSWRFSLTNIATSLFVLGLVFIAISATFPSLSNYLNSWL